MQREVAFSQENDGGIVKEQSTSHNNPPPATQEPPLHKGASFMDGLEKIQAVLLTFVRFCDIIKAVRKLIDKLEFEGLV